MSRLADPYRIVKQSIRALEILNEKFPQNFNEILDLIKNLKGRVILTGIGKSGYIAQKIASSFASTGTPSFYLHPAEASHGDLGMITGDDLIIMLSKSGETQELFNVITYCKKINILIIGITAYKDSTLGKSSDLLLLIPDIAESSLISAPTSSCIIMLALGDALTVSVQELKNFTKEDFFKLHPGGKIGFDSMKVENLMRKGNDLPAVYEDSEFSKVISTALRVNASGVFVIDFNNRLKGIIMLEDIENNITQNFNLIRASDVAKPCTIFIKKIDLIKRALKIMKEHSLKALPIIEDDKLVGVINICDIKVRNNA